MRKLALLLLSIVTLTAWAQVTTIPAIVQQGYRGKITIIFNPNEGNKGMVGATACYAHTGVVTDKSAGAWTHVQNEWRDANPKTQLTKVGDNWQMEINDMYTFYGVPAGETILKLAFVFNDGKNGTKEGKTAEGADIFVDLAAEGLAASLSGNTPEIATSGANLKVTGNSTMEANLVLKENGATVKTATGTSIEYTRTLSATGDFHYELTATAGGETVTAEWSTCVPAAATVATRPSGIDMGIYYNPSDHSKVTLATFAARCAAPGVRESLVPAKHVFVVGDFNDWTISNEYQMKRDGNYFWLEVSGLTEKTEYAFQYVVVREDGVIKYISDLYSEKLLHPDDKYEPRTIDPDLKEYPEKGHGYVTVIETGKEPFAWSPATLNFQRPDKNNLIIYETWTYDFAQERCLQGMLDRIDYIANLGVNALELMPVCEFDGNQNWGYSPNHYFAVDKAYGTPEQLKTLIDECHKRGIAVILDMVFNHGTGLNPMNALYPWGNDLKYNPWFNVNAPHPDNVYEDWNHDFGPAHQMFIRALKYWIEEYKVDGYRLDLSHGLCGASYNAVTNLKDYYTNGVKAAAPDAYMILEHWGEHMGEDRPQLVNAGMLCWENTCKAYQQTAMGWLSDDNLNTANKDGYVSYTESHDEERTVAKAKLFGASDLKTNEEARMHRVPLNLAFLCMLNGSHMFYHYNELGFDYSKFQDKWGRWGAKNEYGFPADLTDDAESVKMWPKARPEKFEWFAEGPRMRAYQKVGQILQLRTRIMPEVFAGNPTAQDLNSGRKLRSIQWGSNVYVVGNFSATEDQTATLPAGTWYDYLEGGQATAQYTLKPGDVKVFTGSAKTLPNVPSHYDYEDGVENISVDLPDANAVAYKVLRDGRILIVSPMGTFDMMGQRVK